MKEVKYIPGDLMKFDGKTVKITFVGRDVIEYIPLGRRGSDKWRTSRKMIEPISLTPEILEKNGWKRTQIFIDDDGLEFHTYIDDERCLDLQYYPQYKKFAAFICKQEVLSDIEYVHQLQHLLFGLGINHEMEV